MPRLTFAELLRSGQPLLGSWSQIASEECIDILGASGLQFTVIDCEHGAFGIETAERLIRACDANGLAPLVRAPTQDRSFIGRALDAGASAVVVPGIASAAQAAEAVRASRYAPDGTRGACPCVRSCGQFASDWPAYARQAREVGIVALVETPEAVAHIDDIVRVDGLLALMVGPFDLSVAMGLEGDHRHPDVASALSKMVDAARAADLPVMVPLFEADPAESRRRQAWWLERGVRAFLLGTDKLVFADAMRRQVRALVRPPSR